MSDTFVAYEDGLQLLLKRIDITHPEYSRITSLQTNLQDNIAQVRRSDDTKECRKARRYTVTELNTIVKSLIGISFIDLCILTYFAAVQTIGQDAYELFNANETIYPDQCKYITDSLHKVGQVSAEITIGIPEAIAVDLYHIDDCIIKLAQVLEDFKEVCRKPLGQVKIQKQQILHKFALLLENLAEVNISFGGFINLQQDKVTDIFDGSEQVQQTSSSHLIHQKVEIQKNASDVQDRQDDILPLEFRDIESESMEEEVMQNHNSQIWQKKQPSINTVNQTKLRNVMVRSFNLEELGDLCADIEQDLRDNNIELEVNLNIIGGEGLNGKIRNLIGYLARRGYLSYLIVAVHKVRPRIAF